MAVVLARLADKSAAPVDTVTETALVM